MPLEVRSENQAPQFDFDCLWKEEDEEEEKEEEKDDEKEDSNHSMAKNQQQQQQRPWIEGILSMDPGVRTFMSGYSPSGLAYEWAKQDVGRIYRLCHAMDRLQSRWSGKEIRHRKRYRLKRAARRIRKKIRNLVDEVHKKQAKWIVEQYHTVLLPVFETSGMVRRIHRRIGSKTARAMLGWAHYRFQQRLIHKTRVSLVQGDSLRRALHLQDVWIPSPEAWLQ